MSKELNEWIEEQYFQLLCNGHTRDRAKQLILDELKQDGVIWTRIKNTYT